MSICEDVSICSQILMVGMWRSCSRLMVVVCIVPLIPLVMIVRRSIVHPSWVSNGCRMAYFVSFLAVTSLRNLSLK